MIQRRENLALNNLLTTLWDRGRQDVSIVHASPPFRDSYQRVNFQLCIILLFKQDKTVLFFRCKMEIRDKSVLYSRTCEEALLVSAHLPPAIRTDSVDLVSVGWESID
jgi:hypothetical protein